MSTWWSARMPWSMLANGLTGRCRWLHRSDLFSCFASSYWSGPLIKKLLAHLLAYILGYGSSHRCFLQQRFFWTTKPKPLQIGFERGGNCAPIIAWALLTKWTRSHNPTTKSSLGTTLGFHDLALRVVLDWRTLARKRAMGTSSAELHHSPLTT